MKENIVKFLWHGMLSEQWKQKWLLAYIITEFIILLQRMAYSVKTAYSEKKNIFNAIKLSAFRI